MKKKSYFIKSMFSYIVMFVVLGIAVNMFSFNTAMAQTISWPNAEVFTQSATTLTGVSSDGTTVCGITAEDVVTINEGVITTLHPDANFSSVGVGGIGGNSVAGVTKIYNLLNLEEILVDYTALTTIPWAKKGDTLVYKYMGIPTLKIGSSDPVELVGPTSSIKGYVINNNHIFVYELMSSTQTKLWNFDVNNLANPTSQIIEGYVTFVTFLDNIQIKKQVENASVSKTYINFNDLLGWQEIDANIFQGVGYNEFSLSYYGENNDICLTCLNTSTGDLRQIYTEGFPNSENDILTFSFPEQTGEAVINATSHTVNIEVAYGTVLTALTPTITVSANATIDPLSGVAQDFSSAVTYTVTAENGETQDWTVTVTEEAPQSNENDILSFSFAEQTGVATINATNHTVNVEVANGTVLTALTPTITVSANATINPLSGVARDFSSAVTYTVTAEDGTAQDWTVNVDVETSVPTTDNSQLLIYPNPTSGWLKIETTEIIEKVTISDLSGRIMLTTDQSEIDLSQIANGSYLISIETHETVYTNKILITR